MIMHRHREVMYRDHTCNLGQALGRGVWSSTTHWINGFGGHTRRSIFDLIKSKTSAANLKSSNRNKVTVITR